jgi:hypothetical protein
VTLVVSCIINICQRSQKLKALKQEKSAQTSIHPSNCPSSPTTFKSELDEISTAQMSAELDPAPFRFTSLALKITPECQEIYELPVMEAVDSELLRSSINDKIS